MRKPRVAISAFSVVTGSDSGTVVSGLLLELDTIVSSVISASRLWYEVSESESVPASSVVSSNFCFFGTLSRLIHTIRLVDVMVGGRMFGVIVSSATSGMLA